MLNRCWNCSFYAVSVSERKEGSRSKCWTISHTTHNIVNIVTSSNVNGFGTDGSQSASDSELLDLYCIRSFDVTALFWKFWVCYTRDRTCNCPTCRTSLIATRFWVVMICPIIKGLTVLEFSFILFDLCLFITIFNFILNYVPIVTFWIFTYHKIWILLIIFCFIWSYWIIFFNMFGSVWECCELTGVSLLWPWLIKWK